MILIEIFEIIYKIWYAKMLILSYNAQYIYIKKKTVMRKCCYYSFHYITKRGHQQKYLDSIYKTAMNVTYFNDNG